MKMEELQGKIFKFAIKKNLDCSLLGVLPYVTPFPLNKKIFKNSNAHGARLLHQRKN